MVGDKKAALNINQTSEYNYRLALNTSLFSCVLSPEHKAGKRRPRLTVQQSNNMSRSPSELVNEAPLRRSQILVVLVCAILNALDGFDILSISFAAPGIAQDWSITRAQLGVALSAEIVGMALGSVVFGWLADSIGRRPTALICLFIMTTGMLLASSATGIAELGLCRLYTGCGIGGTLAVTNALVAEHTNVRVRTLAITIMTAGFPVGAILGGIVAGGLLQRYDWHSIFIFGAAINALMIPVAWLTLRESVAFLEKARPKNALQRINDSLGRMGIGAIDQLPPPSARPVKSGIAPLFSPDLLQRTFLLTLSYFSHTVTFYFMLKWVPKIVVDMGFHPSSAANVLVFASAGGLVGAISIGMLSKYFKVESLLVGALVLAGIMIMVLGRSPEDLVVLSGIVAVAGFFANAAVSALFAVLAKFYPSDVRARGTGFAIGIGRIGGAIGPVIAGYLFTEGFSLSAVASFMAAGSLVAAGSLTILLWNASSQTAQEIKNNSQ